MSFGSPTPIEVAVQGASLANDYGYAQKIQSQLAKLNFVRDLQFAQEYNYPTLDIDISRERAGQFGLTMADVVRSVVPATSSSRFTEPNYWRDPNSGNAFQIQVELPQNRMQSVEEVGELPIMLNGQRDTELTNIAQMKLGTMPGLIERFNGQHIVSLTANIHGITLGEATQKLNQALARRRSAAPRGQSRHEGRDSAIGADHFRIADRSAAGRGGDLSAALREFPVDAVGARHRSDRSCRALRSFA